VASGIILYESLRQHELKRSNGKNW
jgi:hypothetical protein